ncbi:MAG TPA: hypothetical protein VLS90_08045 [Thermodesulfobacteriota bacterium]|nr:hypothetical protein [Thermodesulfobacteriota bacterium]
MKRVIRDKIDSALAETQKRHLKFDKETSLFYSPQWQAHWLETVEKELKQTQGEKQDR